MKLMIDMDGTLAEWKSSSSPEELLEEGYFFNLRPLSSVLTVQLLAGIADIYILSAVIPYSRYAKTEKRAWVHKYLPEIPDDHILFSVDGMSKREFAEKRFGQVTKYDILLDDYSKNLDDWSRAGTSVKFLNGINGSNGRQYEHFITDGLTIEQSVQNALYLNNLILQLQKEEKREEAAVFRNQILSEIRAFAVTDGRMSANKREATMEDVLRLMQWNV